MALGGAAARRYAEALLEAATGDGQVDAFRASLERVREAFGPDVVRALRDRRVPIDRRRAALDAAVASEPPAIRAVLRMLLERDRLALADGVARAYADLVDEREGIVKAVVTTPVALDDASRSRLITRLEQAAAKKVRASFAVDPSLLGGATVRIGDRLIDTSVRAKLAALRAQLAS